MHFFSPFLKCRALSHISLQIQLVYNGQTTREKKTTRKRTKPGKVFEREEGREKTLNFVEERMTSKNETERRKKKKKKKKTNVIA